MKMTVLAALWVLSGLVAYGLVFHYFQHRFRYFAWPCRRMHRVIAALAFLSGPGGLVAWLLYQIGDSTKSPWRLQYRTVTPEESWQAFQAQWPTLPKEDWLNVG